MALVLLPVLAMADGGMWLPNFITPGTRKLMKDLGLKISPEQLYNPAGGGLTNAVVSLGGGFCSGVVVSDKGLMFTNHHCGYGFIQEHSSVEHDYLKNGFAAMSYEEELPNPDFFVSFLIRTDDVTSRVLAAVPRDATEAQRYAAIDSVSQVIVDEAVSGRENVRADVSPFYGGSEFYLSVYKDYTDVRLVFAPPSSVGKFGGDTDNWMWPRHTCDFSVFRIYADKDNEPAEYSKDNVPFKPSYFAPVSLKGYEEGSFCMTMGYPGSTERYLSSYGVEERVNIQNTAMINVRTIKLGILKEAMDSSDEIRIKYAAKYAGSSNYWKNSIGMNKAIKELDVIDKKRELENRIEKWANKKPGKRAEYLGVFDALKKGYADRKSRQTAKWYMIETFFDGADIMKAAFTYTFFNMSQLEKADEAAKTEIAAQLRKKINEIFKDSDSATDVKLLSAMLKAYKANVKSDQLLAVYDVIDNKFGGDIDAYVIGAYANTRFADPSYVDVFLKGDESIVEDPMMLLASDVAMHFMGVNDAKADTEIAKNERLLTAALRAMESDKDFYPDANSTMRLSFGTIGGYEPKDGLHADFYTTTRGIFEKMKDADQNADYKVLESVVKCLEERDYGRYGNKHGDMNTCFISNNDITGGNSGSGMFNGKGELIGLAFDGNWEAMSGDIVFEPNLQRCIGVDIRYVLYIIDKYGKDHRLIKELKLKK